MIKNLRLRLAQIHPSVVVEQLLRRDDKRRQDKTEATTKIGKKLDRKFFSRTLE